MRADETAQPSLLPDTRSRPEHADRSAESHSIEPEQIACPFCHATDIEPLSLFGSQLMTEQFYCRACRTPFEHMRSVEA